MAGKEPKEGYDFERADYFLKKARVKFKDDFIGKKYLISAVMDLSNKKGYEKVCDALEKLSENQIKRINDASSDDKIGVIKTILKGFLEN